MRDVTQRATIGVLINWPAYQGTTIRGYQAPLLQGMHAASVAADCNLLLACDINQRTYPHRFTNAWSSSSGSAHFLPVGPWNTDGLIIVADALSDEQTSYLADLLAARHPVVFAGFPGPGPSVVVDNARSVHMAFDHLRVHGHTRIAFLAGFERQPGDSQIRFQAYQDAVQAHGLPFDPRLVAYGQSGRNSGRRATHEILARGVPFTALLAHNDASCIGAVEALRESGYRVPEDVAVIGFDDVMEARAITPPLTTIHHPTFMVGSQAVRTMLDVLAGQPPTPPTVQIPARLVIRRSCGCRPGVDEEYGDMVGSQYIPHESEADLVRLMASAPLLEAQTASAAIETACQTLITSFTASLASGDSRPFIDALIGILRESEARGDDAYVWQSALSTLRAGWRRRLPATTAPLLADEMLDQARQVVGERVRRQMTHAFLRSMDAAEVLGLMTAELLAALDEAQIASTLAEYLPRIGVRHLVVARFEPEDDDQVARSTLLLSSGLAYDPAGQQFPTRCFPPPGVYPIDRSFQIALLPLAGQPEIQGFVAFDAANLEPCAVIARNLAAALRSGYLYAVAHEARLRAEEATRLKSRFLSMVSHDLRTPLNLIIGLSEMVLREQATHPDTIAQDIRQISMSAQHLGQLIGDVLDLASSEAGQLRLLREPLNLTETLRAVALTGEQMARAKGLDWQTQMPAAGPWVLGDRTRLRQIVLNLISNAVKFTASGSVTLSIISEGGSVRVAIRDTGLGVPLAEQPRIFDEFQRGERMFAHGYDGLGLGLAICKQLVELHGGAIGVESSGEDGGGATFFFTVPTIGEALASPALPAVEADGSPTIVVLTESTAAGGALEAHLRGHGWVTRLCRVDLEPDWLQHLLSAPPSIILLDSHLALGQGWQIRTALERHPATLQIPLLVGSLDLDTGRGALLELNYQHKPLSAAHVAQILSSQGLLTSDEGAVRTVLVVDDDPGILRLHTRLLQEQGRYRVVTARNGREALERLAQTLPSLVLLDLLMPDLDGFGVLDAMRAMEQARDVPVVVLTAQALTEADMERLNHGAAAILSKGLFSADEILGHIDAALLRTRKLGGATRWLVRRALAYIHACYAEPLSRTQIARHIGVTEDYLTDCFHQELGVPPMNYLTRYRIRQARELLEVGAQSVTDVALSVGFADRAHFSRVFQREVGISPNAYRRGRRTLA